MLGLYIHVPFCAAICNYCNFNRGVFDADLKARYVDALLTEIDRAGQAGRAGGADTIYFGGGTPSLLEPGEVGAIVAACARAFALGADSEITLEANPETVTRDRLAAFRAEGVTRLSVGVQSFRDDELRRLSRLHTAARARAAVGEARAAGFDNVSIDLMMWLPGQSVADWLASVDDAVSVDPDHLSLYLLEVYPNAPLREEMARARWSQAPDEDAEAMYLTAMERLEAAGYRQYEISNVAKAGRRSRHNLKYWTDGEWLGLGCGAHSTQGGVRWKNVSAPGDYVRRIASRSDIRDEVRSMSADERLGDALFTGLRLTDGIDLAALGGRYGVDLWARYGGELDRYLEAGCLIREGPRLRLTRRGMLLAHEVMAVFV
ncbi:MAG: radical SAM family heme chaperone HemW [Acidobacteria bacterium]|nr:radical SAM family heme chaperone HemW [Acidobacteriota bacterium]